MSGLLALLDDVAGIPKVAAASVDDIAGQAAKAATRQPCRADGIRKCRPQLDQAAQSDGQEDLFFIPEVQVQGAFVVSGGIGDGRHGRFFVAPFEENGLGFVDDAIAALLLLPGFAIRIGHAAPLDNRLV